MHRFSNALGEPCHLWYDPQLTTGCGSLRADAVRFLPASLPHSRSHHCQCYCLLHCFARVIHHRSVALPRSLGRVPVILAHVDHLQRPLKCSWGLQGL